MAMIQTLSEAETKSRQQFLCYSSIPQHNGNNANPIRSWNKKETAVFISQLNPTTQWHLIQTLSEAETKRRQQFLFYSSIPTLSKAETKRREQVLIYNSIPQHNGNDSNPIRSWNKKETAVFILQLDPNPIKKLKQNGDISFYVTAQWTHKTSKKKKEMVL
jgi:hypothetical protein